MALDTFCRHKAYFIRLRWDRDLATWASVFAGGLEAVGCDGPDDPRCLPLHVFRPRGSGWSKALGATHGRAAFARDHGPASCRTDAADLLWETGPNHAGEPLAVAGRALPAGFHWDVQGTGQEIWTPTEGWLVRQYINVAPDAHLRGREPFAKPIPLRR